MATSTCTSLSGGHGGGGDLGNCGGCGDDQSFHWVGGDHGLDHGNGGGHEEIHL